MSKGIYTALSGAMAHGQKLETISNNIANVNSPSFKRDQQVFREYLTANEKQSEMDVIEVPKIPASIESFYQTRGGEKGYVENIGSFTDFSQGHIKSTSNPLDVAIDGDAFFEILTPRGVMLTRGGAFKVNNEGTLVNGQGYPVLLKADPGTAPEERKLSLTDPDINIDSKGTIYQSGQAVGDFSLLKINNQDSLQKIGNSLYQFRENQEPNIELATEYDIKQGYLEASNVNIVKEMTDMINATRTFEATQKVIKTYDQMNEKTANEVPRLG